MAQKFQWMSDLLDKDSRIMGVYLALICLRFLKRYDNFSESPSGKELISLWRNHYDWYFRSGAEAKEAIEAGEAFIDRLFKHENVVKSESRNFILDLIEHEFYNKFASAFRKYLRLDVIIPEFRPIIHKFLQNVASGLYKRPEESSICGSHIANLH